MLGEFEPCRIRHLRGPATSHFAAHFLRALRSGRLGVFRNSKTAPKGTLVKWVEFASEPKFLKLEKDIFMEIRPPILELAAFVSFFMSVIVEPRN